MTRSTQTELPAPCPRLGAQERESLLAISEWCWRRFKLTRPTIGTPDGPSLGAAISDALHAIDGTAPASYPQWSREGLLGLLSEDLPLVETERAAVRALITAADTAISGLSVAHRRELFLLARTSLEEGTGDLARAIQGALTVIDTHPPLSAPPPKIEKIFRILTRGAAGSPAIRTLCATIYTILRAPLNTPPFKGEGEAP